MQMNTYKAFGEYKSSMGGSYRTPFQARYYQKTAMVSPGKANASMTVTMLYQ